MRQFKIIFVAVWLSLGLAMALDTTPVGAAGKPAPDEIINILKEGNKRFVAGGSLHEHADAARLKQAGSESQGDHAIATVISCSDSRVPVELIFDAGIMDLFIVRVAGNVVQTDEAGSIEYGLGHVFTPVLVVLGHTQCGAVMAVAGSMDGHGHSLERNIPPLIAPIVPAVKRAMTQHPDVSSDALISAAIEENVWQSITDLFMQSPATRELVKSGRVKVVGAIYDVGTGRVRWLPEDKVAELFAKVEADPARAMNAFAQ
jgi:carbonic anhydrase